MIETELKITLDSAAEARLRRHPALAKLRALPRRTEGLVSIYFDSADHALAKAGIALRLRKVGRRWVQTVKRGREPGSAGLFSTEEIECPAPGGRLALDGADPDGVYAAIDAATAGAPLSPVFETRVRRTIERLNAPGGGLVELAIDAGEIIAGDRRAEIREAEIELAEGSVASVFAVARTLFATGPIAFATSNKSARGYRLARDGAADAPIKPRGAGSLAYTADATVESVARDVFRDCFAQIAANMVLVARSDAVEGPHQLRVGLRRLRSAFAVFAPSLGTAVLAPLSAEARRLGQVVGALRDLDVLIDEVVAEAALLGLDQPARDALVHALDVQRIERRSAVRAALAAPEAVSFQFDLAELIEGRGWLAPADYSQTERLAAPIGSVAPEWLDKRYRKVLRMGRRIEALDAEHLHELRKELKKLRYAADVLDPIYPSRKVEAYLKSLKELQDTFGSLNDAAMASAYLCGNTTPAPSDAAAQRGVGWVLGTLAVRVAADRPRLFADWQELARTKPFWS